MSWFLSINVFAKSTLLPVYLLSGLLIVLLIVRLPRLDRPKGKNVGRAPQLSRWILLALLALILGGATGLLVLWLVLIVYDTFGGPLTPETWGWAIALFAALGLVIANFFRTRLWRKAIALLTVPIILVTAALGINVSFGLNPTVGAMLDISLEPSFRLPSPAALRIQKNPCGSSGKHQPICPPLAKRGLYISIPRLRGSRPDLQGSTSHRRLSQRIRQSCLFTC